MKSIFFFFIVFFSLSVSAQWKIGDNLGNHKATQDLNMNSKKIVNVDAAALGAASMTNTSVQLELGSGSKALLINRVASTAAVLAPVNGMIVYNNADNRFYLYASGSWVIIAALSDFTWGNVIGKPSFATVATTGSYTDLINKPVNVSAFTNDAGYITSAALTWSNVTGKPTFATVATTGSYTDLINKPVNVSAFTNDAAYITAASLTWSNVTGKPTFATVATTGSYTDLINKPTIPSTTSGLTNDAGFITTNGRAYPRRSDGTNIDFIWSGQSGQPSWLYGSNDGVNNYVWNPSNFSVNYASTSGNSATTSQRTFSNVRTDGINRGSYGSVSISGNSNGWAGIDFADASTTLMVRASDGYSGMYRNNNTWLWSFDNNGALAAGTVPYSRLTGTPSLDFATHRGEGTNFIDYSRYVYNNGAYSGSGWVEPSDLGVRYANSAGSAGTATNGRYVYNNGSYGGTVGYIEPSSMQVYYAYLGRLVYNNAAYSGSGWVEPSDLGVRYANSAGSAGSATNATNATNATYGRYVYNDGAYSGSGWVEASNLGVRYAGSAGSAGYVDWGNVGNRPSGLSSFTNDVGYLDHTSDAYITARHYYKTNSGGYLYQTNTPALEAYSDDGSAAYMSFHRGGNYAINFGLDPDNVLRVGGWSLGGVNIFSLDMAGTLSVNGYMYAQQFITTSDSLLKNVLNTPVPKNTLSLKLHAYNYKSDSTKALHYGYLAQEVERIMPSAVSVAKRVLPLKLVESDVFKVDKDTIKIHVDDYSYKTGNAGYFKISLKDSLAEDSYIQVADPLRHVEVFYDSAKVLSAPIKMRKGAVLYAAAKDTGNYSLVITVIDKNKKSSIKTIPVKVVAKNASLIKFPEYEEYKTVNYIEVHNVMINELLKRMEVLENEVTELKKVVAAKKE